MRIAQVVNILNAPELYILEWLQLSVYVMCIQPQQKEISERTTMHHFQRLALFCKIMGKNRET